MAEDSGIRLGVVWTVGRNSWDLRFAVDTGDNIQPHASDTIAACYAHHATVRGNEVSGGEHTEGDY